MIRLDNTPRGMLIALRTYEFKYVKDGGWMESHDGPEVYEIDDDYEVNILYPNDRMVSGSNSQYRQQFYLSSYSNSDVDCLSGAIEPSTAGAVLVVEDALR